MQIKRVQVSGGFLDGLDLHLTEGLNVLIGSRGVGKTSIIELIRFCLDVGPLTTKAESVFREQAEAILDGGTVSVTVALNGEEHVLTRAAQGYPPEHPFDEPPVILAQSEIEGVGVDETARAKLIDEFWEARPEHALRDRALIDRLRTILGEINRVQTELDQLESQAAQYSDLPQRLKEAERNEAEALSSLKGRQPQVAKLKELRTKATNAAATVTALEQWGRPIDRWVQQLERLVAEPIPAFNLPEPSTSVQNAQKTGARSVELAKDALDAAIDARKHFIAAVKDATERRQALTVEQAKHRKELEELQQGVGQLSKIVTSLRESAGAAKALQDRTQERLQKLGELRAQRARVLDDLDQQRASTFEKRKAVAHELSSVLSPTIRISVEHAGLFRTYANQIAEVLRGSGLKYKAIATELAKSLSPRELVEAIEEDEPSAITEATSIPLARARTLLAALRVSDYQQVLLSAIGDAVELELLVGGTMRKSTQLSTGQRCTVVLPILLAHEGRVLIVDQPEDHLDNQFVVETLVRTILRQKQSCQLLMSTHNPNIPVLAEAENVVLLGSDGRRGFVMQAAPLEAAVSVQAISTLMEGGKEAFQRRATFYKSHDGRNK